VEVSEVSSDPKEMVLPTNFDENLSIRLVGADILSNDLDVEEQTVDDVNRFRATSFCNATKSWSTYFDCDWPPNQGRCQEPKVGASHYGKLCAGD
jgi:hypothetical protein